MPLDAQHSQVTIQYAGCKTLSLETGEIGRLAGGSVMLTAGETMIYSNACAERDPMHGGFTPLQVSYQERLSAAGRTAYAPKHAIRSSIILTTSLNWFNTCSGLQVQRNVDTTVSRGHICCLLMHYWFCLESVRIGRLVQRRLSEARRPPPRARNPDVPPCRQTDTTPLPIRMELRYPGLAMGDVIRSRPQPTTTRHHWCCCLPPCIRHSVQACCGRCASCTLGWRIHCQPSSRRDGAIVPGSRNCWHGVSNTDDRGFCRLCERGNHARGAGGRPQGDCRDLCADVGVCPLDLGHSFGTAPCVAQDPMLFMSTQPAAYTNCSVLAMGMLRPFQSLTRYHHILFLDFQDKPAPADGHPRHGEASFQMNP